MPCWPKGLFRTPSSKIPKERSKRPLFSFGPFTFEVVQVKTKAIVLSQLKYGESSLIVRMFTVSDGLKSYLLKGVFGKKRNRIKPAYFLPFSLLEIEAVNKNKGQLEQLREVRVLKQKPALNQEVVRSSLVLFLAEVVGQSVADE